MQSYICATCGVQYPPSEVPPKDCAICQDSRQYVGFEGQQWTTLEGLRRQHRNIRREQETGLTGFASEPKVAIGQRCLLLEHVEGNLLWECISLLDGETVDFIRSRGGLRAMAISHPHYYSTMVEWSHAFGKVPIYLHADETSWVMRPDPVVRFWEGETLPLGDGLTLVRLGGHFKGGQVLHWAQGAAGRGALLAGDIVQVVPDRRWVSFMYSYPNLIPLPAPVIDRIEARLEPFEFERIYGIWFDFDIVEDAKGAVRRSAARYRRAITEGFGT